MCRLLYQEFDARLGYILPEAHENHRNNERIKAYSYIAPSAARDGDMYENAYFPTLYVDNQLLCSLCGPKRSHAFNSASLKHNNQV